MKGYGIEIKNNLIEPKHRRAMGIAYWEYTWLLDHITLIDSDGLGHIFKGAPIKLSQIGIDLGLSDVTISRNLNRLKKHQYINLTHTPYGIKISVNKAHKWFNTNDKPTLSKVMGGDITNDKPNKTTPIDNSNKTTREGSIAYLKELPLEDLERFGKTYQATRQQILDKAEGLALWCETKGKAPKNYRAMLQGALLRDYGKRSSNGYIRV